MYERLEGNNIVLRKAKMTDYEPMLKNIWSNEEVYKWMLFKPTFTALDAIERCRRSIEFQKEHDAYFVALKSTDEPIGLCAIDEYAPHRFAECGICIAPQHQGKGYGKEVVTLLLELVFNKLEGIDFKYGYIQGNIKSKKLAESLGFEYKETGEIICPRDGEKRIIDYCYLSKEKWEEKR